MTEEQINTFCELIKDIIVKEEYCRMQEYRHHLHSSTFEHSIKVAYLCYRHYLKHGIGMNPRELIRAALLHDYFLYDHHDKKNKTGVIHLVKHPKIALENAMRAYPDLSRTEKNAIKRHMFPLTVVPPTSRCGWLICFYDKVAAIDDCCMHMKKNNIFKNKINFNIS